MDSAPRARSRKALTSATTSVRLWSMMKTILLAVFLSVPSFASELAIATQGNFFDINEVSLDYRLYSESSRLPLVTQNGLPNRRIDSGINLNVNIDIARYLYWDNTIHTYSDAIIASDAPGQHRTVSWEYSLGVRISKELSVGYYHHSQHVLDTSYANPLPLEDAIQIKFTIFKQRMPRESLF